MEHLNLEFFTFILHMYMCILTIIVFCHSSCICNKMYRIFALLLAYLLIMLIWMFLLNIGVYVFKLYRWSVKELLQKDPELMEDNLMK